MTYLNLESKLSLSIWPFSLKSAPTSWQRREQPLGDRIIHLPQGQQRARRIRPAVPHDTCPCSPGSVVCCSLPVAHSPPPKALPALVSPRLLPASGSRWGYYHWSMSEGMKVYKGWNLKETPPKSQLNLVRITLRLNGAIWKGSVVSYCSEHSKQTGESNY